MESYNLKIFAEELKTQRVKKKVSLLQIKNRTRIDVQYLEAIEKGNFDVMPEVYIRAFIREYAESVGLDPQETLSKYDYAKSGKVPKKEEEKPEKGKEELKFEEEAPSAETEAVRKTIQPWLTPAIIGGIVFVLFVVLYLVFFSSSKDEIVVEEKPYEEIVKENRSRFEVAEQEGIPPAKTRVDSLELKIIAVDTSWIQVTLDNGSSKDFILYPGRTKRLKTANWFDLRIGNSGGVKLLLNRDTLDFKGVHKKPRHLLIDSNGLKFVKAKKKNEQ